MGKLAEGEKDCLTQNRPRRNVACALSGSVLSPPACAGIGPCAA
jgi:hypothetical protein